MAPRAWSKTHHEAKFVGPAYCHSTFKAEVGALQIQGHPPLLSLKPVSKQVSVSCSKSLPRPRIPFTNKSASRVHRQAYLDHLRHMYNKNSLTFFELFLFDYL